MALSHREVKERDKEIIKLHKEEGISINELAARFDLTPQRISQILERYAE